MGLFSAAKKLFKKVVKPAAQRVAPVIGGAVLGAEGAALAERIFGGRQQPTFGGGALPALPPGLSRPTRLPRITGRIPTSLAAGGPGVRIGGLMGAVACPPGFHPAKDGSGRCVRNRRMNVLNHKAAMRAIRRIKGARKMLQRIERSLPKQRTTRRVPGHRARLSHE